MSEPGELFKEAQKAEPLFKEEVKQEQLTQNQDQFLEADKFQEVVKETTEEKQIDSFEGKMAESFLEAAKEKLKADNSDPQEPEPAYVSLHATNITVTKNDSKKMQAVKEAVQEYQKLKAGNESVPVVARALDNIIKMCNSYTWGKFSLFTFGKSKVMLNEVKQLRQQAEQEMVRMAAEVAQEKLDAEKNALRTKKIDSMYEEEDEKGNVITLTNAEKARWEELRTKELKEKFPTLTDKDIVKIMEEETSKSTVYDDDDIVDIWMDKKQTARYKKYLETKDEKERKKLIKEAKEVEANKSLITSTSSFDDVDREVQRRFKRMNIFKKIYHGLLGKMEIRWQVMQEWGKTKAFGDDYQKNIIVKDTSLSKNDTDNESTFI